MVLGLAIALIPVTLAAPPQTGTATARAAHEAYTKAINSNNVETYVGMLTDDVVIQSPNEPEIVGKKAVRAWAAGYVEAYKFVWTKKVLEFVENGDWAFERYSYQVTNTSKSDGSVSKDEGKAMIIYRKGKDGRWRVARDGWSSNLPVGSKSKLRPRMPGTGR